MATAPPFPPSTSPSGRRRDLPRTIGFWGATGVMVGIIIGSGIFRQPPEIARALDSPILILSLWLVGGLLALCGALTYSELATMYPQSGGVYVFLREGLGRGTAFVFGWTYMLISKPFAAAGIAVVCAESFNRLAGRPPGADVPLLVCGVLIALTALNTLGMRLGAGVAGALTIAKVGALVAMVLLALLLGAGDPANLSAPTAASAGASGVADSRGAGWALFSGIVVVMAAVMWTCDGWSDVGAVAGEVKNPQRDLPRAYLVGTGAVTLLYVAVNAVYFMMVPLAEMRGVKDSIAPLVVERLIGGGGATAVTVLVLLSTLGSTHGSIITGARITYQQSRDGLLFGFLGRVHPRFGTPDISLWVQCALSCTAVLVLQDFQSLAEGFVFTMWIFYGLSGAAIFVLRTRLPDAARPFRCPGYPVVPAIFVLAALAMTIVQIVQSPWTTLPWLRVLLAGVPAYLLFSGRERPRTDQPSGEGMAGRTAD